MDYKTIKQARKLGEDVSAGAITVAITDQETQVSTAAITVAKTLARLKYESGATPFDLTATKLDVVKAHGKMIHEIERLMKLNHWLLLAKQG